MNTNRNEISNQHAASLATELQQLGRLLEQMDNGTVPLSARQYRRAAVRAGEMLSALPNLNPLRQMCTTVPALRDLLQNELFKRAAAAGTVRWSYNAIPGSKKRG